MMWHLPDRAPRSPLKWLLAFCLLALLLESLPANACSVPVFRYGLERWPPDMYTLKILTPTGQLSESDRQVIDLLKKQVPKGEALNLSIVTEKQASQKEPIMSLTYPEGKKHTPAPLSLPLNRRSVESLLQSPVRKQLAEQLRKGNTTVWLFLDSGDSARDDAALKRLKSLLDVQKTRPPSRMSPLDAAATSLKMLPSIIRIKHNDPKEKYLIYTLLHSEPELADLNAPLVFPVFGQGRLLYALAGRGINERNVNSAVAFITGPCSCEVKALNPGLDLLVKSDWELDGKPLVLSQPVEAPLAAPVQTEPSPALLRDSAKNAPAEKPVKPATAVNLPLIIIAIIIIIVIVNVLLTLVLRRKGH